MQTQSKKIVRLAFSIVIAFFVRKQISDFFGIDASTTIFSDHFELGRSLISSIGAIGVGVIVYYLLGKFAVFKDDMENKK